jgi:hypothetical protein
VAVTEKKDDSTVVSNKKEKEPDSEILHNPTRVVKAQVCFLSFRKECLINTNLLFFFLLATFNFITKRITISNN